jgi:hypothetical protein
VRKCKSCLTKSSVAMRRCVRVERSSSAEAGAGEDKLGGLAVDGLGLERLRDIAEVREQMRKWWCIYAALCQRSPLSIHPPPPHEDL